MVDITMPQLGESVETGTITRWLKHAGDPIAVDEPLFEVGSDKVTMEIPSLVAGRVGELLAAEGDEVPVGSVVARIATADDVAKVPAAVGGSAAPADAGSSGRNGASSAQNAASLAPDGVSSARSGSVHQANGERRGARALSPVVRRLAREHGIDVTQVSGSANGRVTKRDLLAYVESIADTAIASGSPAPIAAAATSANGAATRGEPLSPARSALAQRLGAAQKSAVNVFSVIEIDMERVAAARAARKLTYLPFVVRAVVDGLRAFPALNASIAADGSSIERHADVHVGVAVDLDENGLVVPVLRDAQTLTVDGLAREIARLADGARAHALRPDAYTGSTFSVTNNGAFGALMTAPVINAPNVAIVSTDAVEERAVVIDHMIAIRRRMYFCMTWDHRAFDGSTAARFLAHVKRVLETWDWNAQ